MRYDENCHVGIAYAAELVVQLLSCTPHNEKEPRFFLLYLHGDSEADVAVRVAAENAVDDCRACDVEEHEHARVRGKHHEEKDHVGVDDLLVTVEPADRLAHFGPDGPAAGARSVHAGGERRIRLRGGVVSGVAHGARGRPAATWYARSDPLREAGMRTVR